MCCKSVSVTSVSLRSGLNRLSGTRSLYGSTVRFLNALTGQPEAPACRENRSGILYAAITFLISKLIRPKIDFGMRKISLLFLLVVYSVYGWSQSDELLAEGKVTDSRTGKGLKANIR